MPLIPEPSKSFKRVAALASWSRTTHTTSSVVDHLQTGAQRRVSPTMTSSTVCAKRRPRRCAKSRLCSRGRATVRKQPDADDFADIAAASRQTQLKERERSAAERRMNDNRRLSADEIRIASELFWQYDSDANASIDKEEWAQLMGEIARRSGRQPASPAEVDAMFLEADRDGNGTLDLQEWIAAQKIAPARRVPESSRPSTIRSPAAPPSRRRSSPTSRVQVLARVPQSAVARRRQESMMMSCTRGRRGDRRHRPAILRSASRRRSSKEHHTSGSGGHHHHHHRRSSSRSRSSSTSAAAAATELCSWRARVHLLLLLLLSSYRRV